MLLLLKLQVLPTFSCNFLTLWLGKICSFNDNIVCVFDLQYTPGCVILLRSQHNAETLNWNGNIVICQKTTSTVDAGDNSVR